MTDCQAKGLAFGRAFLADPDRRGPLMAAAAMRAESATAAEALALAGVIDLEAFATGMLDAAGDGFDDDDRIELTERAVDLYADDDAARSRSLSVGLIDDESMPDGWHLAGDDDAVAF